MIFTRGALPPSLFDPVKNPQNPPVSLIPSQTFHARTMRDMREVREVPPEIRRNAAFLRGLKDRPRPKLAVLSAVSLRIRPAMRESAAILAPYRTATPGCGQAQTKGRESRRIRAHAIA
jgi:hypothetical protein